MSSKSYIAISCHWCQGSERLGEPCTSIIFLLKKSESPNDDNCAVWKNIFLITDKPCRISWCKTAAFNHFSETALIYLFIFFASFRFSIFPSIFLILFHHSLAYLRIIISNVMHGPILFQSCVNAWPYSLLFLFRDWIKTRGYHTSFCVNGMHCSHLIAYHCDWIL